MAQDKILHQRHRALKKPRHLSLKVTIQGPKTAVAKLRSFATVPQHLMRRTGLHPNASRTARKLGHQRGYSIPVASRSTVLAEHVPKPKASGSPVLSGFPETS